MRILGFLFLTVGFFGAAFICVRHADAEELLWQTLEWGWYGLAFGLGVTGVFILRITAKGAETQSYKIEADLQAMESSLSAVVTRLCAMRTGRESIGVYEVHGKIDAELAEDLATFANARETLIHCYGVQEYADLMTRFAGGERLINRAWSASADGYVDEVWICVDKATEQMEGAQTLLHRYKSESPGDL